MPALGQTTGFGKTNTPKFNSTELEGTVLFWVDILSKGIPMLPYLDGDNDMINNNVSAAAVGAIIGKTKSTNFQNEKYKKIAFTHFSNVM